MSPLRDLSLDYPYRFQLRYPFGYPGIMHDINYLVNIFVSLRNLFF